MKYNRTIHVFGLFALLLAFFPNAMFAEKTSSGEELPPPLPGSWERYVPGSIAEVIEKETPWVLEEAEGINLMPKPTTFRNIYEYVGPVREIDPAKRGFLYMWVTTFDNNKELPGLYMRELLVKEGGDEYWLPVQEPTLQVILNSELFTPGDEWVLYIFWPGCVKYEDEITWFFFAMEYQTLDGQ